MAGWLFVGPEATAGDDDLRSWVERCVAFATSLRPKTSEKEMGTSKPEG